MTITSEVGTPLVAEDTKFQAIVKVAMPELAVAPTRRTWTCATFPAGQTWQRSTFGSWLASLPRSPRRGADEAAHLLFVVVEMGAE